VVLIFIFAVIGFIPGWRHLNSDFSNYYVVAHLYREGYPLERVYEWIWLQRHADHLGIGRRLVSYIPLTLPSALAVLPLSSLPPLQAKRCWLLLNLAFLGLTLVILARSTNLGARRVGLLMFMALIPLSSNFVYGQMHVLVLLLVTIAAWMYFEGWSFSSGLALAVGAALKIYPGLFLIFFLIKKQWRAAAGLVIGMGAVTLVSIRLFGMDACRVYLREVLPFAMRAQSIDPYDVAWGSPNALLARLLIYEPELNPFPVVHLPWLYAFLYALILASIFATFLWAIGWSRIKDQGRAKLEWASYLVLLLLVSSQPAPYHFVALILPVVLIADFLAERGQWIQAAKLTGLYVLVCGSYKWLCADPTGWKIALCFPRLLFMLLLSGLIWQVLISSSEEPKYLQSRSSLFSACVFVALFASGFVGSLQHFHGQFDNYESRVVTVAGSGLALDPVVRQGEVFFSALVPRFIPSIPDTYAVHELSAGSLTSFAFDGDWVHPSVGKDPHTVWAEMVTTSASQIVRFSSLGPINSPSNFTVEAENAEEPVVSSDGELLAFIREVRGRNSLWVQQVSPVRPEAGTRGEHQIADSEYDVREAAFFPDHRIVFSSRQGGRFRLYEVDPVSALIKEMTVPTCSARYPAISPDGGWLAFSCEERGTWQIHVMNLRTTEQASLTNADCNSISPVWTPDSKNLIYATDCGRGLGLTALARLNVVR
jgi:Glycosyltransferase family 87/WD40-like Beta Propeller Repeat